MPPSISVCPESVIQRPPASPLLYGCDVSRPSILFNIYKIEVIWGVSDDDTIGEDAKIAILATGLDDEDKDFDSTDDSKRDNDDEHYRGLIKKLYSPGNGKSDTTPQNHDDIPITVTNTDGGETPDDDEPSGGNDNNGTGTEANTPGGDGTLSVEAEQP